MPEHSKRIITDEVEKQRLSIRATALRVIRDVMERPRYCHRNMRTGWLTPPLPRQFRNLEPLGWGGEDHDRWWFAPETPDLTPDVVWPIRAGIAIRRPNDVEILQVTTAPKEKTRGIAKLFSRYMMRVDQALADNLGLITASSVVAWIGGRWQMAEPFEITKDDRWVDSQLPLMTSVALRQRYEWAVSIGREDTPSVRFVTDPTGIKDVFRLRDLPEGRDRREALMHWITDHWRQTRHDPDVEFYVRSHLRGSVSFDWQGMECEIQPAPFDLDKNFVLKDEREAMRRRGDDRRRRAR